jgi:hypothetical protein
MPVAAVGPVVVAYVPFLAYRRGQPHQATGAWPMARAALRWNSALFISGLGLAGEVSASGSTTRSVARSVDLDRHLVRVVESLFLVTSDNLDVESDHVKGQGKWLLHSSPG